MRYVRMAPGAVAAACVLAAAGSASASAAQFIAKNKQTSTGLFQVKGAAGTEDGQTFNAVGVPVSCAAAHGKGSLMVPGGNLLVSLTFSHCTTELHAGAISSSAGVTVKGPLELEYTPAGTVRVLVPVTLDIKALGCAITLEGRHEEVPEGESQDQPGFQPGITYANEKLSTSRLSAFPTGFQDKLVATDQLVLQATAISGAKCKAETNVGTGSSGAGAGKGDVSVYEGAMPLETVGGDLGIEEEEGVLLGGWNRVTNSPPPPVQEEG
jgi:hypothetical protein